MHNDETISFRLSAESLEHLRAEAAEQGIPVSELLRARACTQDPARLLAGVSGGRYSIRFLRYLVASTEVAIDQNEWTCSAICGWVAELDHFIGCVKRNRNFPDATSKLDELMARIPEQVKGAMRNEVLSVCA